MNAYVVLFVAMIQSLTIAPTSAATKKVSKVEIPPRLTTLRASPPSRLLGGRIGQRELRFISVQVANVGDVAAKDIQVYVEAASGLSLPLKGPKRLAPHTSAVYATSSRISEQVGFKGYVKTVCSTCRR
jgi:hypothetical protein